MPALTLAQLAEVTGARLQGDAETVISSVNTLDCAGVGELCFLSSSKFSDQLSSTNASVVIVREIDLVACPCSALVTDNPRLAYAYAAAALTKKSSLKGVIHSTAVVAESARVDESVCIGPNVVIGDNVTLSKGVIVGANCVVENDCTVENNTYLKANVTLYGKTQIGKNCLIHSGAVIGSDGFGFEKNYLEDSGWAWVKIPQLGRVIIGDDVEVGACTTIDRGAMSDTIIKNGVKLDNQIHIAHNVEIGSHTAIAAGTGIAGSTKIGKYCTLAGQVGVFGHLLVADHVDVSAVTTVTKSIDEPGAYSGTLPAMPRSQWKRNFVRIRQLDDMSKRLNELEKQIIGLKSGIDQPD